MIGYASRTGTRRNLEALRGAGWRLMVSARGPLRPEGFRYALDNGAWTAHLAGEPFDAEAFQIAYDLLAGRADFVVLPDIVAGGAGSLAFSLAWAKRLEPIPTLPLLAVQDGMEGGDIAPLVGPNLGIFVGGSTAWKEATLGLWAQIGRRRGAHVHVGRVNTARRISLCQAAGIDSFDGSSVSRYAVTLPKLERARQQGDLWRPA